MNKKGEILLAMTEAVIARTSINFLWLDRSGLNNRLAEQIRISVMIKR